VAVLLKLILLHHLHVCLLHKLPPAFILQWLWWLLTIYSVCWVYWDRLGGVLSQKCSGKGFGEHVRFWGLFGQFFDLLCKFSCCCCLGKIPEGVWSSQPDSRCQPRLDIGLCRSHVSYWWTEISSTSYSVRGGTCTTSEDCNAVADCTAVSATAEALGFRAISSNIGCFRHSDLGKTVICCRYSHWEACFHYQCTSYCFSSCCCVNRAACLFPDPSEEHRKCKRICENWSGSQFVEAFCHCYGQYGFFNCFAMFY